MVDLEDYTKPVSSEAILACEKISLTGNTHPVTPV